MEQNPLTPEQAIEYLKARYNKSLKRTYLAKLRSIGHGPLYFRSGASVLYDQIDIDNWVLKNRTPKGSSATQISTIQDGIAIKLEESEPLFPDYDDGWVSFD